MNEELTSKLLDAVKKKAMGYVTTENVEEYAMVDGDLTVVKRKVTQKEVPPDVVAVKFLMDAADDDRYSDMTEDELEAEKIRLLKMLKEAENATCKSKAQNKVRNGRVQK
ncbi:MAG: hypothetical protein IKC48_00130 [Clostridia bacterium]|nr:hypothetical protein [Clostridia bacterium]